MLDFPRWKTWGISLICLIGVLLAIPSMFSEKQVEQWAPWLPSARINLGLDLAGGSYLLLEADTKDLAKQRIGSMEETMRTELRRASPRIEIGDISTTGGQLSFMVRNPAQVDAAMEIARSQAQPVGLGGQRSWTANVLDGNRIVMAPTQAGLDEALDDAMDTAREVLYLRTDPTGASEVDVRRKGEKRIEIQVPGLQDPERLKALLGKTARLEFKLVTEGVSPEQLSQGRAPVGSEILPYPSDPLGRIAVQRRVMVAGEQINNARQSFDESGRPSVDINFNTAGAKKFGVVTQQNVNKPFAIILDDVVIVAPNIEQPILGGRAEITGGNFTVETANDLAVQLRSGRLPVDLTVMQESSVGPELGAESIYWGSIASVGAVVAVMLFMVVTYGRFGVYAMIGLVINALMILGIMALFNATLTLPGIAGFVLTIGAAVDANVLINERIREEIRRGRKSRDAIETGYREASTAIFDANITNVIAAMIMFYFGSGPISGFATVLMIGIVTSVFTAVNVSRMFVALWVRRARPRSLTI